MKVSEAIKVLKMMNQLEEVELEFPNISTHTSVFSEHNDPTKYPWNIVSLGEDEDMCRYRR